MRLELISGSIKMELEDKIIAWVKNVNLEQTIIEFALIRVLKENVHLLVSNLDDFRSPLTTIP